MTLVKWNPNTYFKSWEQELDNMFNALNTSMVSRQGAQKGKTFSPATDVREFKKSYQINLELPGMDKEDITIEVKEGRLTISGEKKGKEVDPETRWHFKERAYGSFAKSFELNNAVKESDIKAHFADGVLTLELPKAEEAQPKKIDIQ